MKRKILVTGASGHLGKALLTDLLALGEDVRILVLPLELISTEFPVEIYSGDVTDMQSLEAFFNNTENEDLIVIHCAGIVSITSENKKQLYKVNVDGTKYIIECCKRHHVKKLIYVSSVHAIPEKPDNAIITETSVFYPDQVIGNYAKTKSAATNLALQAACDGLFTVIVHPSGIIGPYDDGYGHMSALIKEFCSGRLFCGVQGGYDFVDVRDVSAGILSAMDKGENGNCYILSNRWFSIKEIFDMLSVITGKKRIKVFLPCAFAAFWIPLAKIYSKTFRKKALFTHHSLYTLSSNANFSHEKANCELGYSVRDMSVTLTDTVQWLFDRNRLEKPESVIEI